jgi:hypothetical protein
VRFSLRGTRHGGGYAVCSRACGERIVTEVAVVVTTLHSRQRQKVSINASCVTTHPLRLSQLGNGLSTQTSALGRGRNRALIEDVVVPVQ